MAELPVFKYYNINEGVLHSSSDGQKFGVSGRVFKARHSPKYFGREKGISVLTLNANYQALSSKIISANEYEGHHVLELLLMNESEVQPKIHSTDTHGTNDINFAFLDLCGYYFAPRYAKLNHRSKFLYSPENPAYYDENYILKPIKKIDVDLILEEEMNIKRVIASMVKKTNTVGTIVKKLNSCRKSNKIRKALVEYDKMIKSTYILTYIDDLGIRQSVQVSLNRIEGYHQMRRSVSFDNLGKMRAKTESEQLIYQECNRLICNAIIYYNSYIMSSFLEEKLARNEMEQIEALRRISPIAWNHINLYGKYDFEKTVEYIDVSRFSEFITDEVLIEV